MKCRREPDSLRYKGRRPRRAARSVIPAIFRRNSAMRARSPPV